MQTLAIIGTGIAGMSAGYHLRHQFDITFYEKNNYPGGHTNTLTIDEDGTPVYIDSGFIVYNEITYPHLTQFFKELGIVTKQTSMSFSVQHVPSGLEYCGTGINGLFAQRKNLFNPSFIRMLLAMDRFNKEATEVLDNPRFANYNLAGYVKEKNYGDDFLYKFLIPMSSAVWSTPPDLMLNFSAVTLVRFFKNHGFLGLHGHYPWRTVEGGSRQYRDKVLSFFRGKVHLGNGVVRVALSNGKVRIEDNKGQQKIFDKVILACHADEALKMLEKPTKLQQELLSVFSYQKNRATLHTDSTLMPKTKRAWSSWNYRIHNDRHGVLTATTIYDMNSLQGVSKKKDYFISINDPGLIDPRAILWEKDYDHPIFDVAAIKTQQRLNELNYEEVPIYFCGSYFRYGFHEDAFLSGLTLSQLLSERAFRQ